MSSEPEEYLAVLKAAYDYEPQEDADDEIAIKENQLLLLLERTDDDWWKVKIKADSQEDDTPSGLVPSAYVEPAEHISIVKALYEYEAQQPGELSVSEDEVLYVYGKDEDWLLVHSQKEGGKVGYVPGNYVEEVTEEGESSAAAATSPPAPALDLSKLVIPDSPPKPAYTDPEELVNKSKAKAQAGPVETWSVSEVDKKGKKKKGTLGVGNGAMFFASESDKTPVQKWQTTDILTTRVEKNKHLHIDIGGTSPVSLHFHAGSKDVADAIMAKLQDARLPPEAQDNTLAVEPPPERPRSSAQKSVHFDNGEPEIIPPREDDGQSEPDEEEYEQEPNGPRAVVLYDFQADEEDEMTVAEGETLLVLKRDTDEWWKCRNSRGQEGVVPANYLELVPEPEGAGRSSTDSDASEAQAARDAEERRQKEEAERKKEAEQRAQAAAARAEADRRRREQEREKQAAREREQRAADAEASKKARDSMDTAKASKTNGSSSRSSTEKRAPPTANIRTWHDRTGQFRVDAAFLGFANGKLRLHKVNGVVIEVPSEKMSADDMKYVERLMAKQREQQRSSSPRRTSDDIPLEIRRQSLQPSKKPSVDWFEFFLSAGCDVDDCSRYALSFERDKIDEAILPDITESTMRSLGLREGDIIRVKKAIEARKPKPVEDARAEQLRRDEELAKQLQAQETGRQPRGEAPNLFSAGPDGKLKNNVRRGRPQSNKGGPPSTVDINAISSASDQIQRTGTPSRTGSTPTPQLPERSNSAAATPASGFDDDAWTVRPSSTTPIAPSSPANNAPPPPPAPPAPVAAPAPAPASAAAPPPPPAPPAPAPAPPAPPAPPASAPPTTTPAAPAQQPAATGGSLANKTEADIFDQLARLSQLRIQNPVTTQRPASAISLTTTSPPPLGYQSGLGMGTSPAPLGQHLQAQSTGMLPPPQPINGPRGPLAPVPANQALLQPLIPTNTGFNSFVPTRPQSTPSYLQSQPTGLPLQPQATGFQAPQQQPFMSQPTGFQPSQSSGFQAPQPTGFQAPQPTGFQAPQPTGFQPSPQPLLPQATGFQASGPLLSQPTGMGGPFGGGMSSFQGPSGNFGQIQPTPTGFNPGFGQFNAPAPPPQQPASNPVNTNPANIFAQMKSGTFGQDNNQQPQSADKYDALRPQPTGWGGGYQGINGYSGGYGFQQ